MTTTAPLRRRVAQRPARPAAVMILLRQNLKIVIQLPALLRIRRNSTNVS